MNTSLYSLAAEYQQAAEHLANLDLDEQTIADTLEGLAGSLEVKATNVAMFIRNTEALAVQIKEAEAAMAARRKALESRAERIKQYLKHNMEACGIQKIESPYFVLSIAKNPPSVHIEDEKLLPAKFMVTPPAPPPQPDKTAIKEALKAGQDVPGARLNQGTRLSIK